MPAKSLQVFSATLKVPHTLSFDTQPRGIAFSIRQLLQELAWRGTLYYRVGSGCQHGSTQVTISYSDPDCPQRDFTLLPAEPDQLCRRADHCGPDERHFHEYDHYLYVRLIGHTSYRGEILPLSHRLECENVTITTTVHFPACTP